jgi:hypothetical protein
MLLNESVERSKCGLHRACLNHLSIEPENPYRVSKFPNVHPAWNLLARTSHPSNARRREASEDAIERRSSGNNSCRSTAAVNRRAASLRPQALPVIFVCSPRTWYFVPRTSEKSSEAETSSHRLESQWPSPAHKNACQFGRIRTKGLEGSLNGLFFELHPHDAL